MCVGVVVVVVAVESLLNGPEISLAIHSLSPALYSRRLFRWFYKTNKRGSPAAAYNEERCALCDVNIVLG